jgi:hypothetical protein
MSNFQGQIIDPVESPEKVASSNKGFTLLVITLVLVLGSFFTGLFLSNAKIDENWNQTNFNTVEVNKDFQFSTSGTTACDANAVDGCVGFRFVSKYDCQQVSGLVALVNATGKNLASVSAANSNITRGMPFEIKFNLPSNSQDVVDTNLLDVRCFR